MFDIAQDVLLKWLVWAFLDGVALGVFYDLLRVFKMLCGVSYFGDVKKKRLPRRAVEYTVTFFCDLILFLAAGVVAILLIYRMGDGIFRAFTYGALFIGFALYYFTVSRLTLKISDAAVKLLRKILKKATALFLYPVRKIFLLLFLLYRLTIGRIIGKIIREIKIGVEKKALAHEDEKLPENEAGGEGEYVYVGEKGCYRKSGRISFGSSGNNRADA